MNSRSPHAKLSRRRVAVVALLTLTTPLWIEQLASSEPLVQPIADSILREEPGRVAPAAIDEGVRRRLEALPETASEPARRGAPASAPAAERHVPIHPLPRSLDPDTSSGR